MKQLNCDGSHKLNLLLSFSHFTYITLNAFIIETNSHSVEDPKSEADRLIIIPLDHIKQYIL